MHQEQCPCNAQHVNPSIVDSQRCNSACLTAPHAAACGDLHEMLHTNVTRCSSCLDVDFRVLM